MTMKVLKSEGIKFEKVDVTQDADAYKRVTDLGYMQAPVVITEDGDHWSGFRPDLIKGLA